MSTPHRRLPPWLPNLGLLVASLALVAAVFELILFRLLLLPSGFPANVMDDGVVRLRPGDRGIYRIGDEIAAPYQINAQGWNSAHAEYLELRSPGVEQRVAVIGDSYVEALQVPYDRSLAEQLESMLGAHAEVYRFGLSGAPLSQYLHMFEHEVLRYRPDTVVVLLIHNDFAESYAFRPGRYTSSFLKLEVDGERVIGEIEPAPYRETWRDKIRLSATSRYLRYRRQLTWPGVKRWFGSRLSRGRTTSEEIHAANLGLGQVRAESARIEAVTDYLFARLKEIAENHSMNLLLVIDGVRSAIYDDQQLTLYYDVTFELNAMTARLAARHDIPFVDLHPWMAADWQRHGRRFEFASDWHWNEYGHGLAAMAIYDAVESLP